MCHSACPSLDLCNSSTNTHLLSTYCMLGSILKTALCNSSLMESVLGGMGGGDIYESVHSAVTVWLGRGWGAGYHSRQTPLRVIFEQKPEHTVEATQLSGRSRAKRKGKERTVRALEANCPAPLVSAGAGCQLARWLREADNHRDFDHVVRATLRTRHAASQPCSHAPRFRLPSPLG